MPTTSTDTPSTITASPAPESLSTIPPQPPHPMKWMMIGVATVAVLFLLLIGMMIGRSQSSRRPVATISPTPMVTEAAACTLEAKLCPDGSSVGRTGPNCEFAPCPTVIPTSTPAVTVAPTATVPPLTAPIVVPSNWISQSTRYANTLSMSLRLPPDYKLLESNADLKIQQQYPPDKVVTSSDPPTDELTFSDGAYGSYDGSSRRDFYRRYLNGQVEGVASGPATILSVTEHPLTNNSYIKFITKNESGNPNTVHYITVKNNALIVFQGAESSTSVLQQNIDKIFDTLQVTKN